jgi:Heterokaryon incompatibility protein Het-C
MKNYIANSKGDWATSVAFVKHSFERSIHHGRLYTNGHSLFKGKDEDLAEALRLLGQGLHCLEDFGAHTNYVELALREQGFHNIFPHTGTATQINLRGKHVFPLVTGTFGMVDFYHSVLGEATDHFTQSEVNEMDNIMEAAQSSAQSSSPLTALVKLLSKVPGTRELCIEAEQLQRAADTQAREFNQGDHAGWYVGNSSSEINHYAGAGRGPGSYGPAQPDESAPQAVGGFPSRPAGYGEEPSGWHQPPPFSNHSQQPNWSQQQGQQQYQAYNANQGQFTNPQHPQSFNIQDSNQPQQPQWQQPQHPQSFNMQDSQQPQWQQPQHHQSSFNQQQISNLNPQQSVSQPQQPQWQQPQYQQPSFNQQSIPNINPQPTPSQPLQSVLSSGIPNMPNFDPAKIIAQIYPILAFRDKVVRTISAIIEKIPGLEAIVDLITETLTVFVLSLLAPFVRPVLKALTKSLQVGSTGVVESSANHQFEPWTDPHCTDPTHSLLSKDHFSNILNPPAGAVAAEIVKFIAPRVLYAWQHPDVPVQQVLGDVEKIFHHPAIRDGRNEVHRAMFEAVQRWVREWKDGDLNDILSSEGVKTGKNQKAGEGHTVHTHGTMPGMSGMPQHQHQHQQQQQHQQQHGGGSGFNIAGFDIGNMLGGASGHGGQQHSQHQQSGGYGNYMNLASKLPIPGMQNLNKINKYANIMGSLSGGGKRELDESEVDPGRFGGEIGGKREFDDAIAAQREGQAGQERWQNMEPPRGYEDYGKGGQQSGVGGYGGYGEHQGSGGASGGYYGGSGSGASDGYYR